MRLIVHIVQKDLRRLRWWLVAWAAVLALPLLLAGGWATTVRGQSEWTTFANTNLALVALQVLVGYVVVLVLMHEDPVFGTRQAWVTRPIAPWRMLLAKAGAALLVIGGGASLVALPWWIWCGFDAADIGAAALEYILLAVLVIVPAMFMATITDSLPRAILWSLVLFAVAAVWVVPLTVIQSGPSGAFVWRIVLATAVWLIEAALVVAMVFTFRWRGRLIGSAVAVMLVSWLGCMWAPWDLLLRSEPRVLDPEKGAGVQLRFHEALVEPMRSTRSRQPACDHMRVSFGATGAQPDLDLAGVGARQTWRWAGLEFTREGPLSRLSAPRIILPGFTGPQPDPETEAYGKQVAAKSPRRRPVSGGSPPPEGIWLQAYTHVPSSIGARMAAEPPSYEVRLWLAWVNQRVRNDVPLQSGSVRAGDSHRIVVHRVNRSGGEAAFEVTHLIRRSWIRQLVRAARERPWFTDRGEGYVLLNRDRKELRMISTVRRFRPIFVHGVEIQGYQMSVPSGRVRRGDVFVDRPGWMDWMDGASLAFVESRAESVFTRDVRVEDLRLRRPPLEDPRAREP